MKKADKTILAQFAYLFGNGMGKERMKSNAEMQRRRHWLLNCINSSEKSVEGIFESMEQAQAAGMVTRLVDIDMIPTAGLVDSNVSCQDVARLNHWSWAGEFEMTIAITRADLDARGFRAAAGRTKDAAARRMLALALVLEGQNRTEAAHAAGMDRQTLRERVHRYNAQGLRGLSNRLNCGGPKCQACCVAGG